MFDGGAQAAAKAEAFGSDVRAGIVSDYDWVNGLVAVNIGGVSIWMPWFGMAPWRGNTVRVFYIARKPFCTVVYGAAMGTVQSVASNIATVLGDDGVTYRYPYESGATLSNGHRVRLDHAGQVVVLRYSAEPPGSDYTTPAGPGGGSVTAKTFRPKDSANFKSGVFQGQDVRANINRSGAYYYGTQIADSIPDSAVIVRATITLTETFDELPQFPALMGSHTHASRAGEPTISGGLQVFGSGTFDISSLANALKTGAAFGVGFQSGSGNRGFGTFDVSGSIYMEWK